MWLLSKDAEKPADARFKNISKKPLQAESDHEQIQNSDKKVKNFIQLVRLKEEIKSQANDNII